MIIFRFEKMNNFISVSTLIYSFTTFFIYNEKGHEKIMGKI